MRATNVPVPKEPDCSINVSLRTLAIESTETPGGVGNGSANAVAKKPSATRVTPIAVGRRRSSVRAAAAAISSSGTM